MNRSPTSKYLIALLAVLALAAGAGAFAGADIGGGPGVIDRETPNGTDGHGGDKDKPLVSPDSGDSSTASFGGLTARSLLGLISVPLSPSILAGLAVLVGLFAVAVGRRTDTETPAPDSSDESLPDPSVESGHEPIEAPGVTEENAVYRAWKRLAERVGGGETLTPRERAGKAVESGFDRQQVGQLRRLFERVRYGEQPVTEQMAERAREAATSFQEEQP